MFNKLIDYVPSFLKTKQQYHTRINKLSSAQCPPLVIDDITFQLNSTHYQLNKIISYYDDDYLIKLNSEGLTVQIVGQKYFLYITKSTQTKYNHQAQHKKYIRYVRLHQRLYQQPQLMTHFWTIDFTKLKVLNISQHNLNSIQSITFMIIPNLQHLELHSNNIQSIDCLSKCYMMKLKTITLYNSKISISDKLTRLYAPKLQNYEFDYDKIEQPTKIQNIDFLFKMDKNELIKKLYIHDQNRIINKRKTDFIKNMYSKNIKLMLSKSSQRLWKIFSQIQELQDLMNQMRNNIQYLD